MIRPDLERHFFFGLFIAVTVSTVSKLIAPDWAHHIVAGWATAVTTGLLKELAHDLAMNRGTPDVVDFAATVTGATLGAVYMLAW